MIAFKRILAFMIDVIVLQLVLSAVYACVVLVANDKFRASGFPVFYSITKSFPAEEMDSKYLQIFPPIDGFEQVQRKHESITNFVPNGELITLFNVRDQLNLHYTFEIDKDGNPVDPVKLDQTIFYLGWLFLIPLGIKIFGNTLGLTLCGMQIVSTSSKFEYWKLVLRQLLLFWPVLVILPLSALDVGFRLFDLLALGDPFFQFHPERIEEIYRGFQEYLNTGVFVLEEEPIEKMLKNSLYFFYICLAVWLAVLFGIQFFAKKYENFWNELTGHLAVESNSKLREEGVA